MAVLAAGLGVTLFAVDDVEGATPRGGAMVEAHRHYTGGRDWHVQLEVTRSARRLATVVAYSQACGVTGFAQGATLGPGGTFDVAGGFPDAEGQWTVQGRFTGSVIAVGSWSVVSGSCVDGGEFRASDSTGHFLVGNPFEYAPARINRSRTLRRITSRFRSNAWRFTPSRARKSGYSFRDRGACPSMIHARKHGTAMWGRVLDPLAPQALMYWCTPRGRLILAGAMFRAPSRKRPPTFGNLIQWHRHGTTKTANWMTHLWLVPDLHDAWATCAPFRAFEAAGMFRFEAFPWIPETKPCSDTARRR